MVIKLSCSLSQTSVLVDVLPERCVVDCGLRGVCEWIRLGVDPGLEELWRGDEDGAEEDGDEELEDARPRGLRVVHRAVVVDRVVDGHVTLERDGDGHEDGAC